MKGKNQRLFILTLTLYLVVLAICLGCTSSSFVSDVNKIDPGTWSIIAVDPVTREVGAAGATCEVFAVGLAGIAPNKGVIATQAWGNLEARRQGVDMLLQGASPTKVITTITNSDFDPDITIRQYGVVALGFETTPMAYTGVDTNNWAGDLQGFGVSVQGNELVNEKVVQASLQSFQQNAGASLADRLLDALEAGMAEGGDSRCGEQTALSAFLLVASQTDTPNHISFGIVIPEQEVGGANPIFLLRQKYDENKSVRQPVRFTTDDTISLLIFLVPPVISSVLVLLVSRQKLIKGVVVTMAVAPLLSIIEVLVLQSLNYVFLFERGEYYLSLPVVALAGAFIFLLIHKSIRLLSEIKSFLVEKSVY
ncbi:MAG TPA: DUF1028 domain-containing protein [Anaerolineales bacterium]|nr:DUF1028 domain-containing protein [Anaerolineales bacterium]